MTPPPDAKPPVEAASSNGSRLVLVIRGKQIPSKKNRHYCSKPRPGRRARVLLDEKIKERLEAITRDFVWQLLGGSQTTGSTTLTECCRPSLTVSLRSEERRVGKEGRYPW